MKKILWIATGVLVLLAIGAVSYFVFFNKPKEIEIVVKEEPIVSSNEFDPSKITWTEIKTNPPMWSGRDSQMAIVFKDKVWISGGVEGGTVTPPPVYETINHPSDLWSSSDLINWNLVSEKVPWKHRRSMASVVFKDKLYLFGGWEKDYGETKNDIWATEDGENWKSVTGDADWLEREGHSVVEFNGKLWLLGGVNYFIHKTFNDVWVSEDGEKWTEVTANAPWAKRYDQTLTVYNNKMWVIGGMDFGEKIFKDVWYSDDGITWNLATDNPPWPVRHGHASFEYKGLLWIMTGWCEDQNKALQDVWYTKDGINWAKAGEDAPWAGREDVAQIFWNDKIVILGGMKDLGKQWQWGNDIWQANF